MGRISVWYLIGDLSVGGAEHTLLDLAGELDQNTFKVTIWTIKDAGALRSEIPRNINYRTLDAVGKWDLRAPIEFIQAIRTENPDIVQSFLFFDNVIARVSGIVSQETAVITGVRNVPDERSLFRHIVDRCTTDLADVVVSNSKSGCEIAIKYGAHPEKVTVIHNGRDLEKYAQGTATKELRKELGIKHEGPVVGTVGRILERKGHFDLIESWPLVRASHPDAQLVIVGDGPAADQLRRRVAMSTYSESIKLAGLRDDIPDILDLFDVFAFPSHFEGLPGALLEAMAAGKPIVTTPVDGNSELIKDGRHGIYVSPKEPEQLANGINQLLGDRELANSLGENASRRVKAEFSLKQMVSDFVNLYKQLPQ